MKYTKSLAGLALVAALGLTLGACSANNPSATAPTVEPIGGSASAAASAPASEGPAKSPRGNIIKKVGEPAGMFLKDTKEPTVNFTIDSIAPVTACSGSYPQPPQNGHFVVVGVTVETTEALSKAPVKTFDVSAYNFKFISKAGTTYNGNLGGSAYSCLANGEGFPIAGMGPAEKVSGKVVLDVPETTGTLVFKDMFGSAGWEYNF